MDRDDAAVEIELLPTAHRFKKGHRIRLLIAGGSFPQFARNPGSGENLTATELLPNQHTVEFGGRSSLFLPIVD